MQTPDTLDLLRRQYRALKENAARQCPVTPQIISRATGKHISKIHSLMFRTVMCAVVALLLWPYLCHELGLSLLFEITTILLLVVTIAAKWWSLKKITDPSDSAVSLLELAENSLRAKRRLLNELYIGTVAVALWFAFYCYEIFRVLPPDEARGITLFSVVGAIVGFIIGLRMSKRMREELETLHSNITDILSTETENTPARP